MKNCWKTIQVFLEALVWFLLLTFLFQIILTISGQTTFFRFPYQADIILFLLGLIPSSFAGFWLGYRIKHHGFILGLTIGILVSIPNVIQIFNSTNPNINWIYFVFMIFLRFIFSSICGGLGEHIEIKLTKITVPILLIIVIGVGFYYGYLQSKFAQFNKELLSYHLSYETYPMLASRLSLAITNKLPVSKKDIEKIFGSPDSINTNETRFDNWHYRINDNQNPQFYDVTVTFDTQGNMVSLLNRHQMIDPAIVNIVITAPYWKEKVLSQFDLKYLDSSNKQYHIQVEARVGLSGYVFTGPNEQVKQTDRHYTRQLFPGTYNFYLEVIDMNNYRKVQDILLEDNVRLIKNETRQIRL